MNKNDNFKAELKELLKKYNAEIYFTCGKGSDTYGLYDDRIEAKVGEEICRFGESDNWYIDGDSIEIKN